MPALRTLLALKVGFWLGMFASAAFARRVFPSQGDEESDEVALVAIQNGIGFGSRSKAFKGGSMLAWFGGINVDLRHAQLAPGAKLTVYTLFGGVELKTPPEWRIESTAKVLSGGVSLPPSNDDPDAPVLLLDGLAVFGGIAVGPKP
ncbi:MAG TPA: hypothetical protein VGQ38_10760 [Gaiellaceae bacterium]|nr:hypothetical protein [Gaiellaceae bacterium]